MTDRPISHPAIDELEFIHPDDLAAPREEIPTVGYTENAFVHHEQLDPGVALLNKPCRKTDLARRIRDVLSAPARQAVG